MDDEHGIVIDGTARAGAWRRSRSTPRSEAEERLDAPKSLASSLLIPAELMQASVTAEPGRRTSDGEEVGEAGPPARLRSELAAGQPRPRGLSGRAIPAATAHARRGRTSQELLARTPRQQRRATGFVGRAVLALALLSLLGVGAAISIDSRSGRTGLDAHSRSADSGSISSDRFAAVLSPFASKQLYARSGRLRIAAHHHHPHVPAKNQHPSHRAARGGGKAPAAAAAPTTATTPASYAQPSSSAATRSNGQPRSTSSTSSGQSSSASSGAGGTSAPGGTSSTSTPASSQTKPAAGPTGPGAPFGPGQLG